METTARAQKTIVVLLKDFGNHTATSLSTELKMSRWGMWKILKKLEKENFIMIEPLGSGKTSTATIRLNWDNILVEKTLALSLTQEAFKYKRWLHDFSSLQQEVDFLMLYGSILYSNEANDIDVIGVAKEKKLAKINDEVFRIQETQNKKIHSINLTQGEFKQELKKPNKAYLEAIKKGIILFGQENFIKLIKEIKK
ncbi:hypothetical protein HYV80_04225 [Candidatus Woesearchaeota archaeon]|nr:hypothetical protein [Candidatus Woesearchaeota archaeon]